MTTSKRTPAKKAPAKKVKATAKPIVKNVFPPDPPEKIKQNFPHLIPITEIDKEDTIETNNFGQIETQTLVKTNIKPLSTMKPNEQIEALKAALKNSTKVIENFRTMQKLYDPRHEGSKQIIINKELLK